MLKENTPTIETKRLILRKFKQEDLSAYFEIMNDEEANKFLPWFKVKSLDEANVMLHKDYLDSYDSETGYRYAVCLKDDNIPIGYCNLSKENSNGIGYGLKAAFWHQGIISEATMAMVERIKEGGYSYITATHDINNPRSKEVMKRIGMSYKYSYIENWQPKNIQVTFRMYQLNFDIDSEYIYLEYCDKCERHFVEQNI